MASPDQQTIWILLGFVFFTFQRTLGDVCGCQCTVLDDLDREILLDFKTAITSDPNSVLSSWLPDLAPCSADGWLGVYCNINRKVTCLDLGSKQFSGQISPSLGNLSDLQYLNLYSNELNGSIPSSMGNLSNLQTVYLSENNLTGGIPPSLGNLKNLLILHLFGNDLSGPIPPSLGTLSNLQQLCLSRNNFLNGSLPPSLQNLVNLEILQLDVNQFTGPIPQYIGGFINLTDFNLDTNGFSGPLPASLGQLTSLKSLRISDNQVRGPFPTLPQSLEQLYMNKNQFSGEISEENVTFLVGLNKKYDLSNNYFRSITTSSGFVNLTNNCFTGTAFGTQRLPSECESFCNAIQKSGFCGGHGSCNNNTTGGNECSCDEGYQLALTSVLTCQATPSPPPPPSSPAPSPPPPSSSKKTTFLPWIIGIIIAIIVVLAFAIFLSRRDYFGGGFADPENPTSTKSIPRLNSQTNVDESVKAQLAREMSLADLMRATNNFSAENRVAKGGFGIVYKGVSPSGALWAIKRALKDNRRFIEDTKKEVDTILTMFHKNILTLRGYCFESEEALLVFDFMENGNLKEKLACLGENPTPLNFQQRFNIALDVAEGLKYLHFNASRKIIHRDVKSANILLDAEMKAKVADFGLLKDVTKSNSSSKGIVGTPGYIDPEYQTTGIATMKSDVYSFGVVLLELLSGRLAVSYHIKEGSTTEYATSLCRFAQTNRWDINALIDPKLQEGFPMVKATSMLQLAKKCLAQSGEERPDMEEVVFRLGKLKYGDEVPYGSMSEVSIDRTEDVFKNDTLGLSTSQSSSFVEVREHSVTIMR